MVEQKELKEKFLKEHGWEKIKGFSINTGDFELDGGYDKMFFPETERGNMIKNNVEFWMHDEWDEYASDDIDEVIDNVDDDFEQWVLTKKLMV